MTGPRFISVQIDRVRFNTIARSQAIAANTLALLCQGRSCNTRVLAAYGVRVMPGRALDELARERDIEIEDHVADDWGA